VRLPDTTALHSLFLNNILNYTGGGNQQVVQALAYACCLLARSLICCPMGMGDVCPRPVAVLVPMPLRIVHARRSPAGWLDSIDWLTD
jgi:hypothetical protein